MPKASGYFGIACGRAGDPRVIGVASPSAGDEAAICGAELALAYADSSSEQVLLLEFDTQRPRLAKTLGIPVGFFAMQMYDKYDGSPEHWRALSVFRANLHVLALSPDLMVGEHLFPPVFQHALTDLTLDPTVASSSSVPDTRLGRYRSRRGPR